MPTYKCAFIRVKDPVVSCMRVALAFGSASRGLFFVADSAAS